MRYGRDLLAPLDPRDKRHAGRTHHEALRDLALRLLALEVVETREEAVQLIVVLVTGWPSPFEDHDPGAGRDLLDSLHR